jgi:hypothetical protein
MSHFPMYVSQNPNDMATPIEEQAWFSADQCEYSPDMDCEPPGWEPVPEASRFRFGASSSSKGLPHNCPPACPAHGTPGTADLEPLLYELGVDIYWAGHVHFYQRFNGPIWNGSLVKNGGGYHNPVGPIHVTSGSGGPPAAQNCENLDALKCYGGYSYTRLTIDNSTDLLWEQIANNGSAVVDSWTLHQSRHGPFPAHPAVVPAPPPPPPPPPSPPTPAPAGMAWDCHANMTIGGLKHLKGTDLTNGFTGLSSCESACVKTKGCSVMMWHAEDMHCHVFTGTTTHAAFVKSLSAKATMTSCMLLKK